jgi:uncharacterized protein YbjQ (UPF0145 family)
MYSSPWVTGTRASEYFGPVTVTAKFKHSWDATIRRALRHLQASTAILGANSVVGVEMAIDPFADPPVLTIVGTAAELLPMF